MGPDEKKPDVAGTPMRELLGLGSQGLHASNWQGPQKAAILRQTLLAPEGLLCG